LEINGLREFLKNSPKISANSWSRRRNFRRFRRTSPRRRA